MSEEAYSGGNEDLFLEKDRILGASGFSTGLDKMDYVPGAFIEGAFVIESTGRKFLTQTVTLGGQLSIYSRKLPIMADLDAFPYSAALFVGLQVGRKWK